ncbi:alpha-amylase 2 [Diachasma alloeum]|uniref:alpha-amylase 2 n=1 Tax=Diachasma alloeum TaxID=454923 RepID=UPI0007384928|nr:alpha-amylase 2 [Diachasma alloeum]
MQSLVIGLLALAAATADCHKHPNYAPGHDVIVHLFEWKWNDIGDECERFLGPMGFGGVQVSPIQENVIIPKRPWWERYQPISYRFVTRSGNETEFRDMVRRCNAVGVRIYVDALLNHVSADHNFEVNGTGGSWADPATRNYSAIPYTRSDFHPSCALKDFSNPVEVRNCELVGLHDLNQSVEHVRERIVEFMNRAVDAGVAGFRIDAAKHMWPTDLQIIYSRLSNLSPAHGFPPDSRPYIYQEVIDVGGEGVSKFEYNSFGAVTEFRYGAEVTKGMTGNNPLRWFRSIGEDWSMLPRDSALIFIDNHDNQRGSGGGGAVLTYKRPKLYKMAVAFMLAHPYGNPKIMSSFAFDESDQGPPADAQGNLTPPVIRADGSCGGGWVCEHRWRQIYNMVGFRNAVNGSKIDQWWDNWNNQIAFSRGNAGFIAINADNDDLRANIHTGLPAGVYCDVISGSLVNGECSGKTVEVRKDGYAFVEILVEEEDGVLAIHRNAKLNSQPLESELESENMIYSTFRVI